MITLLYTMRLLWFDNDVDIDATAATPPPATAHTATTRQPITLPRRVSNDMCQWTCHAHTSPQDFCWQFMSRREAVFLTLLELHHFSFLGWNLEMLDMISLPFLAFSLPLNLECLDTYGVSMRELS
jgi:hypothetical protein